MQCTTEKEQALYIPLGTKVRFVCHHSGIEVTGMVIHRPFEWQLDCGAYRMKSLEAGHPGTFFVNLKDILVIYMAPQRAMELKEK